MIDNSNLVVAMKERIAPKFWKPFWFFAPMSAMFLLPFGLLVTYILGFIGFEGVGRLNQLLILFSVFYGFFIGTAVLFFADKLELISNFADKVKWLGRFAIVTPILTILVLFLIFSR